MGDAASAMEVVSPIVEVVPAVLEVAPTAARSNKRVGLLGKMREAPWEVQSAKRPSTAGHPPPCP